MKRIVFFYFIIQIAILKSKSSLKKEKELQQIFMEASIPASDMTKKQRKLQIVDATIHGVLGTIGFIIPPLYYYYMKDIKMLQANLVNLKESVLRKKKKNESLVKQQNILLDDVGHLVTEAEQAYENLEQEYQVKINTLRQKTIVKRDRVI